jgi:hypothetical protein
VARDAPAGVKRAGDDGGEEREQDESAARCGLA